MSKYSIRTERQYQLVLCISEVLERVKTAIEGREGVVTLPYTLINLSLDDND